MSHNNTPNGSVQQGQQFNDSFFQKLVATSSIRLVYHINEFQKNNEDYVLLEHDDFMKKVEEVLGERALNIRHTYVDPHDGCLYSLYSFNFHDAVAMAMVYGYEVAAKVYDLYEESMKETKERSVLGLTQFQDQLTDIEMQEVLDEFAAEELALFGEITALESRTAH